MSTLEELLDEEILLRSRLDKFIENGKKTALVKRTQGFFESKSADLKRLWDSYSAVDLSINKLLLKTANKDVHPYITENHYGITELKYSEYISELTEGLHKLTDISITANPSTANPVHATIIQHDSTLPRISLPKFDGNYDCWRSFHDLFMSLVHNNAKLTPVQKLHHLKTCLIGEAEKVLRHTPITDQDYEPAWDKLKERYENKRILVNHQLKTLINQPKLNTETAQGIKTLLDTSEECLQQLRSLKVDTTSWDTLLIYLLVQKLPFQTLKLWEEELGSTQELPEFKQFKTFLDTRLKILESIADVIASKSIPHKAPTREKTLTYHMTREGSCPACDGRHYVLKCLKFKGMNVQSRRKVIQTAGRCLNCLSKNHSTPDCTSKYKCFKCNQLHHTSLHEDVTKGQSISSHLKNKSMSSQVKAQQANSSQDDSTSATSAGKLNITQAFVASENIHALLSTALVIAQAKHGQPKTLRCLIDPGSQSSFVTESACQKLCAPCTPTSVAITGLTTSPAAIARKQTSLRLRSCGSNPTILEEEFLVLKKITDALPTKPIPIKEYQHLTGLELADANFWKPGKIDALLGARIYAQIIQEGIRRGSDTAPVAINTMFGWILLGPTIQTSERNTASFSVTTSEHDLNSQLTKFWETEEIVSKPILTKEDQDCQDLYERTHTRLKGGKYQVKLPFKNDQSPNLGYSRPQALKRFQNLQRQFAKRPEFQKEYTNCLNEYIELGHMEEMHPPKVNEKHYYIPHHAVFKESSTTRLRVVFDASCKSSNGNSLNDYLLKGPTLQPTLYATLLKWRKYKIAMNADLEKMYRMIEVHPEHRTFQRIIWQHPSTGEIQDYCLKTVTFGTSAAPYLAIRTLLQLAEDEKERWPLASKTTSSDFYVDDLLTGADNVAEAETLQRELIEMLKSGGFNLRKWASNNDSILQNIPIEHREVKGTLTFSQNETIKTLGIQWHPMSDQFSFKVNHSKKDSISTKRTILSEIASLYDPIGWLAPILIVAKILMQTLWITGCSWDNPVSDTIKNQWETFINDLQNLSDIKIPRWIHYSTNSRIQIHGFCDASTKAYAAVLYMRVEKEDGTIASNLLTAKTRVAPIKPTTIPRLELNGAVILARLIKTAVKDMHLKDIPLFAWTDSTIVLQWIKEHPSCLKTYVANRVVEIQDIIRYDNWHHISTQFNPADIASRGSSVLSLIQNDLWWHGPPWLIKDQSEWPENTKTNEQTTLEAKQTNILNFSIQSDSDILTQYSSFSRFIRIIATIQRFIHNCRNTKTKLLGSLSRIELHQAEITILKVVQITTFKEEYNQLIQNRPLSRNSKLLGLNPFLDDDKLIRVGGRLENAMIPYSQRHPIILPKDHHVSFLIIDKIHLETLHGGPSLVLSSSRNRYWILDARRSITSRLHKCITCARFRKETSTQLMGNLPSARVNITKPFTKVGIDYAGPITIKSSPCRKAKLLKAYFCIFICMSTKATHIELVSSMTSEAFIAALKRFIARRGLCTDIYSDCGTNFVGGKAIIDKELKEAIRIAKPEAEKYISSKSINWHFNPPAAPHFGGIWEAGVKSIKYHLRRILKNALCTFEEYATVLAQVESCLNSRPICYIRNDPNEPLILTPGHFLIGQALNAIPEHDYSDDKIPPALRWKYLQQMVKLFWDKWSKDYLNQLQNRPKWSSKQDNIHIGDIVIVKNETTAPTDWPLGKIIQVYPGVDGLVRVVQVKTRTNTFQRPITKICRLPIDETTASEVGPA